MNVLLEKLVPGVIYECGFRIDGQIRPYYSFCRPAGDAGWSDEMAQVVEKPSRTHFIDRYNRRIALDAIGLQRASAYLDVGCSAGYMLEDAIGQQPDILAVGADYFSSGLEQCHRRLPSVPLFQLDLLQCPFPDDTFNAITCLNVLEHIQDDCAALVQLRRILIPGGRLVVSVPAGRDMFDLFDEVHCHRRRYSLEELENRITNSGLKLIKANYFGFFIYPPFYLVKMANKCFYSQLTPEEKKAVVEKQIERSRRSVIMDRLCAMEYRLGERLRFPFGIRAYAIATK